MRHLPALDETPLRLAQVDAIRNVERSLAQQWFDRSLVQMATGAGQDVRSGHARLPAVYSKFAGFTRGSASATVGTDGRGH